MLNKELLLTNSTENDGNTLVLYEGDNLSLMYKVTYNGKTYRGEVYGNLITDAIEDTTEYYYTLEGLSLNIDHNLLLNGVEIGELIGNKLGFFFQSYPLVWAPFEEILGIKFDLVPIKYHRITFSNYFHSLY